MQKFLVVVLFVTIFAVALGIPAKEKSCATACTSNYTPVCAKPPAGGSGGPITFGNQCVLDNYNCESKKNYVVESQTECPGKAPVRLS